MFRACLLTALVAVAGLVTHFPSSAFAKSVKTEIQLSPIAEPVLADLGDIVDDRDFREITGYRTLLFFVDTHAAVNPVSVYMKIVDDQGTGTLHWYFLGSFTEVTQAGVVHDEFIFLANRATDAGVERVYDLFNYAKFESTGVISVNETAYPPSFE